MVQEQIREKKATSCRSRCGSSGFAFIVARGDLTRVSAISAGAHHTVAFKSYGTVWVWGNSNRGHFGDGTTKSNTTPLNIKFELK